MQSKRRWLPSWQRLELVEKCLEEGMTRRQPAAWRRVSAATVQYWVERGRAASAEQLASGAWAEDRPPIPHRHAADERRRARSRRRGAPANGLGPAPDRLRARDAALD